MAKKMVVKKKPEVAAPTSVRADENYPDTYWISLDGNDEIPITVMMSPEAEKQVAEKLAQWLWKNRLLAFELPDGRET